MKPVLRSYNFTPSNEVPILEFFAPDGEVDSLLDTASDNYVTVGHGINDDSSTSIYYRPKPGLYYHVISPVGVDLFKGQSIKKYRTPHCEGDTLDNWGIRFDYSAFIKANIKEQYRYGFIVVGSKRTDLFNAPIVTKIPDSIESLCKKVLLQNDTTEYEIEVLSAGFRDSIWRVFLTFNSSTGQGFTGAIDTDGTKYKVLFKAIDHWNDGRHYVGQADLDCDGFSEVFLTNYGDYGAFNIFLERNGKWIVIHNHGPQEC